MAKFLVADKAQPYIEKMEKEGFDNYNLRRFYKYLDRSIEETLNYLTDNAGNFPKDRFEGLLSEINITDQLKNLSQEQKGLLMDFERRVWKKLGKAEREKDRDDFNATIFENLKVILNKLINIPT